jgi:hypothetical protein
MIPAERSLVDLCEGHTAPLVRVGYVSLCMSVAIVRLLLCDIHIHRAHRDMQHFRRVQRTALRKTEYVLFLEGVING